MKHVLLGMGLLCISLSLFAKEKVDQKIDAAKDGYVEIEHLNGAAEIKGWDKSEVRVVGKLGDRTEEFIFERDGNEVRIEVKVKRGHGSSHWGSDDGDQLEIFIPINSKVSYTSVNADVKASDIKGGANIETVNGEIGVIKLAGRIRLESVNGDISANELEGDVKIETVNGDIKSHSSEGKDDRYASVNGDLLITSGSAEIRAETVNGDIELQLGNVQQLTLETVNGSVEAKLDLQKGGDVRASTVGGSVALYFQDDVSARFDIRGHAGGTIVNKLSEHKMQKAKYGPSRWLEFSLNEGNGKVNVSTVSGRVRLDTK
ncbi:MAG: DUF4097 and DUF4098 domain-containing protein YvlB [Paraglaciecola sp.]|jgi:DUF4097 and DUF4098 domain-containing protein YvlB